MDVKRGIEYAVLLLLLLVPAYALLNEVAKFRVERIDDYLTFPYNYQDFTPTDKYAIARIRDLLLKNSADYYYGDSGMTCDGDEFLAREQELFGYFEQLGCMETGTLHVWYVPLVRACDEKLRTDTLKLLDRTMRRDMAFFDYTAEQNQCAIPQYNDIWDYGEKVLTCICGSQR